MGEDPDDKTLWDILSSVVTSLTPLPLSLFANVVELEVGMGVDGGGDGIVHLPPPPLAITAVARVAVAVGVGRRGRVIDLWIGEGGPHRYGVDNKGENETE